MQQVHLFIGSIKSIIASCALSALFHRCLRRTFLCIMHTQTLIHATNTISSQAWLQKDLHTTHSVQTCCSCNIQFGHLPSSVHASEEPFVCIMQIQTLIHATNTISSQAWVQEDLRTTDFAPSMLFMQHDNLGIYPLQYMPQKSLFSAPCRFRR